jgi:hypothetical protein
MTTFNKLKIQHSDRLQQTGNKNSDGLQQIENPK